MIVSALVVSGILVTLQNGVEIGREEFTDNRVQLASKVRLGGRSLSLAFDRQTRRLTLDATGNQVAQTVPEGVYPIENGSWQSYALFLDGGKIPFNQPTSVKVLVPSIDKTIDATVTIQPTKLGSKITLAIGGITAIADVAPDGNVVAAKVDAQHLTVTPGEPEKLHVLPKGVHAEPFEVTRDDVTLRGELLVPTRPTKKLMLLIAGSGPTDRDGNSALGLRSNVYRDLAEHLATRGVAVVRYDKRGVGQSTLGKKGAAVVLDDFVGDAAAIADHYRTRFPTLILAGHSEGGIIALALGKTLRPARLVLLATPGRPLRDVVRSQLARQHDIAVLGAYDRIVGDLLADRPVSTIPPVLAPIFAPTVLPFLKSVLALDPAALVKTVDVPTQILQGATDIQVSEADAKLLAAARPSATLHIIAEANHLFRHEKLATSKQKSYVDPTIPFAPDFLKTLDTALGL